MNLNDLKNFKKIEAVYGIHNKITNKWYIGSTFNLHDRIRRHRYYLLKQQHHSQKLQKSFNKHGIENFEVIILENCNKLDIDDLINKEIDYIEKFDSLNNGYNMTKDCRTYKMFKLSKTAIKKCISARSVPIVQLSLQGEFIKEFSSIVEAAEELDEQTTNISKACKKGCTHSVKGFLFLYKKDYDQTKSYKYIKTRPSAAHLEKIKHAARNNKRTRKIYELNSKNEIIHEYNSISECERSLNLKKDHLRKYFRRAKTENIFTINNRVFKIDKSYSYKDIV